MMFKPLRLQTKIILLVIAIVSVSVMIMTLFFVEWSVVNVRDKVETNVLNIAQLVAHSDEVRNQLVIGDPDEKIRNYIDTLLESVNEVEFIVVADMDGIRYSHPYADRINQKFQGGDEKKVLEKGETYISEATGSLGESLRAFAPIYNLQGSQIGFVSVGTLTSSIVTAKHVALVNIVVVAIYALIIGGFGAFVLADNIKKTLLGLEPNEIANLYTDKIAMMDAIYEGIVAIDRESKITMINESAMDMFHLNCINNLDSMIGKNINEIFLTSRLEEVIETGKPEFDKEQIVGNTIIMTNRVPIIVKGEIVGAIATFRDKTRVVQLAEELTGVKMIVNALRANTHEFMNKLHVILGLIQMKEYDDAKSFIIAVSEQQEQITQQLMSQIKDSTITGLILGKRNRAKELGVEFKVAAETNLDYTHGKITSNALISIVGNLVENSLEAVSDKAGENRSVSLLMIETEECIRIEVSDNGPGIPADDKQIILERGYTTKDKSRGVGLSIVNNYVVEYGGSIDIESTIGHGTKFVVILIKEEEHD